MPPRMPSTMVRASAWASACFGGKGMTCSGGATGIGTVKAGPVGIRVILSTHPAAGNPPEHSTCPRRRSARVRPNG